MNFLYTNNIDPVVAESQHRRVQKHGQISVEADDAKVKIQRVTAKLEGKDFNEVDENTNTLSVKDQVLNFLSSLLSDHLLFRLTG